MRRLTNQHVILTKAQTDEVVFDGYLSVNIIGTMGTYGSNLATFSGVATSEIDQNVIDRSNEYFSQFSSLSSVPEKEKAEVWADLAGYDVLVEFTGEFTDDGHSGRKPVVDGPWYGVVCQNCQRRNALSVRDRRRKHKHEKLCRKCFEATF